VPGVTTTTTVTDRLERVASKRGWWLPGLSVTATTVAMVAIAWNRLEVDLNTYLLGGAHAFSPGLYNLIYPVTHLGFTYPPFAALVFAPFSHLPLRPVRVGFTLVGLAATFGLVAVSLRAVRPQLSRRTVTWWALALMAPAVGIAPVRETLMFGQVNLILGLAVVADMTLDLRIGKGILVGLAAAIKVTPLILIPYLFLTGRARAGWRAIAAFAAAAAVAAVASPRASWTYWSHAAWSPRRAGGLAYVSNQGMVGFVERLARHPLSTGTTFAIVATVSALGLAVATVAHRRSRLILGFLVVEATESLASPVSWDHHYVWVLLLIAWLVLGADRPVHAVWWAVVVTVVFWVAPIWWVAHGHSVKYAGQGWLLPVANSFFLILLSVVVGSAVFVVRHRLRHPTVAPLSEAA
jgi:alpha-1,2-mannosyltransferase